MVLSDIGLFRVVPIDIHSAPQNPSKSPFCELREGIKIRENIKPAGCPCSGAVRQPVEFSTSSPDTKLPVLQGPNHCHAWHVCKQAWTRENSPVESHCPLELGANATPRFHGSPSFFGLYFCLRLLWGTRTPMFAWRPFPPGQFLTRKGSTSHVSASR